MRTEVVCGWRGVYSWHLTGGAGGCGGGGGVKGFAADSSAARRDVYSWFQWGGGGGGRGEVYRFAADSSVCS